jgi:hydroxyacyl-ACP dehydratase HTD2-like protein with hotdog domain
MREEMLRRKYILADTITPFQEQKINNTLLDLFSHDKGIRTATNEAIPFGHHLVYFNPSPTSRNLLPDGTDDLHSPGAPWVRRMWAGGKLQLDMQKYFSLQDGWLLNHDFVCAESISDVQLRGNGDSAKIFVTIERRFARSDSKNVNRYKDIGRELQDQMQKGAEWGDASLIEERNLVFMKARSTEEVDAIKEDKFTPVRYLKCSPPRSHLFK